MKYQCKFDKVTGHMTVTTSLVINNAINQDYEKTCPGVEDVRERFGQVKR